MENGQVASQLEALQPLVDYINQVVAELDGQSGAQNYLLTAIDRLRENHRALPPPIGGDPQRFGNRGVQRNGARSRTGAGFGPRPPLRNVRERSRKLPQSARTTQSRPDSTATAFCRIAA